MSDETTEPGRARVTPAPEGPVVPDSPFLPQALARPRPRVVVRADLRPALLAAVVIAVLGAPVGWVWSRLAPPQESLLGEQGQLVPLTLASYHQFDALAIYLLLGFATGILTAAALWAVRSRRGPVMLLAGVAGSLLAAWLGSWLGPQFAQLAYPGPEEVPAGQLFQLAPALDSGLAVLGQPLGTALGYGLAASWNGLDDLGRPASGPQRPGPTGQDAGRND